MRRRERQLEGEKTVDEKREREREKATVLPHCEKEGTSLIRRTCRVMQCHPVVPQRHVSRSAAAATRFVSRTELFDKIW